MNTSPRVVLVDGLTDTRDVLSAVFSSRGVVVDRLSPATKSCERGRTGPDVLVLQDEVVPNGWESVPRVVIGRAVLPATSDGTSQSTRLPSPFDYADLVNAVESLLDSPPPAK